VINNKAKQVFYQIITLSSHLTSLTLGEGVTSNLLPLPAPRKRQIYRLPWGGHLAGYTTVLVTNARTFLLVRLVQQWAIL